MNAEEDQPQGTRGETTENCARHGGGLLAAITADGIPIRSHAGAAGELLGGGHTQEGNRCINAGAGKPRDLLFCPGKKQG